MMGINPENYVSENILSNEELIEKLRELRNKGKKIGLCSGSFDLLHLGHITHLISAKKKCDVLIVAIARDHYRGVKGYGSGRPIFSHDLRAFMVSKLKPVDFVILDDGTIDTLYLVKPDIFIKGQDYADEKDKRIINSKNFMHSIGGQIYYTQDKKLSTTDIIKYIKEEIE